MVKIFSNLFSDKSYIYTYDKPYSAVKAQVNNAFKDSGGFFDERDYVGEIDGSEFTMSVATPAMTWGVNYGSTMFAEIIETDMNHTKIKIRFRSSIAFKIISGITVLIGIVYLFRSMLQWKGDVFLWGLAMVFLGPTICNWLAGISNAVIQSRYVRYIHHPLKLK
jgi:hypothetical protein